jgi:hypothetical protein
MRVMIVALFLMAQMGPAVPNTPTSTPDPDFPVHVQILSNKWGHNRYGTHGYGRGNVLDTDVKGFDYTYDCGDPFLTTKGEEFYGARWKKQDEKLEIIEERIGSGGKTEKCELKVDMKTFAYKRQNGEVVAKPSK